MGRRLADLAAACLLAVSASGCAIVPSIGASVGAWVATKSLERYFLKGSPSTIVAASRARVAAGVGDVLSSLDIEQASVSLADGEPHIVEAALPIQGEVVIVLIAVGRDITKITVTARTGDLAPDVEVGKEILARISRALEGPAKLERRRLTI